VCNIYVGCLFYKGRTRAICFKNTVYDLLIGNVPSAFNKPCTEEVILDKKSIQDMIVNADAQCAVITRGGR